MPSARPIWYKARPKAELRGFVYQRCYGYRITPKTGVIVCIKTLIQGLLYVHTAHRNVSHGDTSQSVFTPCG